MASLARNQDLGARLRRQRLDVADEAVHLLLELRQRKESRDVDRDEERVLVMALALRRAFERFGQDRVTGEQAGEALDQERETRALRTAERQRQRRRARIGSGFSTRV